MESVFNWSNNSDKLGIVDTYICDTEVKGGGRQMIRVLIVVFIGIMIEQGFLDLFEKKEGEKEKRAKGIVVLILLIIESCLVFSIVGGK